MVLVCLIVLLLLFFGGRKSLKYNSWDHILHRELIDYRKYVLSLSGNSTLILHAYRSSASWHFQSLQSESFSYLHHYFILEEKGKNPKTQRIQISQPELLPKVWAAYKGSSYKETKMHRGLLFTSVIHHLEERCRTVSQESFT